MVPLGSTSQPRPRLPKTYLLTLRTRWDLWQPGLAIVDVTNPEAREWYKGKLSALLDLGVDSLKVLSL